MTYSSAQWRFGSTRYACVDCSFNTVDNLDEIQQHCKRMGHGKDYSSIAEVDFIKSQPPETLLGVIITLCYLCWNTAQASLEGAQALLAEAARLHSFGATVHVVVMDNGSTDSTRELLVALRESTFFNLIQSDRNMGISAARNLMIYRALGLHSTYILFMDGDIEVVPYSVYMMAKYLLCHSDVGCIGAYSSSHTSKRENASKALYDIPESRVKENIDCAWTQYGLFRVVMFLDGMRFDDTGPLGEPGWGFEDDDLYYQMRDKGWGCRYFSGITYLHRALHSSWKELEKAGTNLEKSFKARHQYMLSKWSKNGLSPAILKKIEARGTLTR